MNEVNDIGSAVEDDLTFDPDVDASDMTVTNVAGEVTLEGTVASYPQYVEAAAVAGRVPGVRCVRNHLEVTLPPGDYRDDRALTAAVNNALTLDATTPAGVEATADNGGITLTGTVRSGTERAAAEMMVAGITGVRYVRNDIQIAEAGG
jgi:osmotically-inducible protein OsmY